MSSELSEVFDLEQLDLNLFRNRHHRENFNGSLFGGQVLSQALYACYQTQDDERGSTLPHSLHAYFLRAGRSELPVIYDVEKVRDGRSIVSRRVVARQYGRPILNMSVSFHYPEEGFHHQAAFPDAVPTPEELMAKEMPVVHGDLPIPDHAARAANPFDMLPVDKSLFQPQKERAADALFWIKTSEALSEDPIQHYCTLAFASDLGLLATTLLPHGISIFSRDIMVASLDHAMWFHSNEFRADEWLLCHSVSPWAGHARGYAQSSVFTKDGKLVLSTAQEGLIRPVT